MKYTVTLTYNDMIIAVVPLSITEDPIKNQTIPITLSLYDDVGRVVAEDTMRINNAERVDTGEQPPPVERERQWDSNDSYDKSLYWLGNDVSVLLAATPDGWRGDLQFHKTDGEIMGTSYLGIWSSFPIAKTWVLVEAASWFLKRLSRS